MTAPGAPAEEHRRSWPWAMAFILVVGAALRAVALDRGLWYDEIVTLVQYVQRPLGAILSSYDSQNQHLLYSILARLATVAFGEGAASLRLPAAVFGVASLWLTAWFGARVAGRREGLLAAALLAVSYHHVWFSQNARGYTILLCGAVAGTALMLDLLRDGAARRTVAAYAVVTALALYTNVTAGFVAAAHGLIWGALVLTGRLRGRAALPAAVALALSGVLALLLYAPVLGDMVGTVTRPTMAGTSVEWKHPAWLVLETARGLAAGVPGGWAGLGLGLLVAGAGTWSLGRRQPVALALMLAPLVVTAAAMLLTRHNLWPRLFFFAAGFVALIAVRGGFAVLEAVVPARAAAVGTAGALLVALASLATVPGAWRPKQDFAGAAAWVGRTAAADDAVVTVDLTRFPYERWLRTGWPHAETDSALATIAAGHARTWVLYTFPARLRAMQPAIWERLQRDYHEAFRARGSVGGGDIVIMVNR